MNFDFDSYRWDRQPEYLKLKEQEDTIAKGGAIFAPPSFSVECSMRMTMADLKKATEDFERWSEKAKAYVQLLERSKRLDKKKAELCKECEARFKRDLFEELGISDNPKREKLYAMAYENGHHEGYAEIFSCAQNLVELIV